MKLILFSIVFFFIALIFLLTVPSSIQYIALQPSAILQGKNIWTLVTHMFMHAPGGLIPFLSVHLLINMFVLFSLGGLMERIIGRKRFLIFYLLSGIFSGLLFVVLAGFFGTTIIGARIFGAPTDIAVGASGAIFAIAGLFVILLPRVRFSIIFFPFFSLPGYIMIPLVLFLTWIASVAGNFPIGNVAHFGGFIMGLAYGIYLRRRYKRKIKIIQRYFR